MTHPRLFFGVGPLPPNVLVRLHPGKCLPPRRSGLIPSLTFMLIPLLSFFVPVFPHLFFFFWYLLLVSFYFVFFLGLFFCVTCEQTIHGWSLVTPDNRNRLFRVVATLTGFS